MANAPITLDFRLDSVAKKIKIISHYLKCFLQDVKLSDLVALNTWDKPFLFIHSLYWCLRPFSHLQPFLLSVMLNPDLVFKNIKATNDFFLVGFLEKLITCNNPTIQTVLKFD